MKIPYLSIKQTLLLLAVAALFFGLAPAIHAEGLSGLKDSLNKGKINKADVLNAPDSQPDIIKETHAIPVTAKTKRIVDTDTLKAKPKFVFVDKKRSESKVKTPKNKKDAQKEFDEELKKNYNKMFVALKQAKKKKKAAPRIAAVRIGDDPETDASIPAKLPEDFLINVDTDELTIRNEVKTLYDSFESLSLDDFNKACDKLYGEYYKTRPDICHLIKLIKADAKLKKDPNYALEDQMLRMLRWPGSFESVPYPTFQTSMHEEYLKMSRDTETGNDLLKFVNKKAKKRQEQIKKANDDFLIIIRNEINVLNKLKADYEKYVKDLLSLTHILPGYTVTYENNPEYLQRVMKYAIDDIKAHYQKISQRYLIIAIYLNCAGQWEESLNLTKEFKDYFEKNCPYKFTIKFAGKIDYDEAVSSGNLGNLKILQGDLLIDKDNLKWGPKRFDQAALECMSRLSLQNVTDQVNNLEFHKKIIEFAEANIEDQEEIKAYKKESKIKEIRFETNEFSGTSNSSRVFAANDRICIKCYYEPGYNQYYRPPILVTLTSTVSNRNKKISIIGNRGEFLPYAIFQPNETSDPTDAAKNLIEVDTRQMNPEPIPNYPTDDNEPPTIPQPPTIVAVKLSHSTDESTAQIKSISVAQCKEGGPGMALKVPPSIYKDATTSAYLNKQLVRSYVKQSTENVKENVAPNSKAFLMSGGAEYVEVNKIQQGDELVGNSKILVKRVANWFIIQGHGSNKPDDNAIGEKNSKSVAPIDLYYKSSNGNEYSLYDGMDVLILDTCYNMHNRKFKGWRKILPRGVIMGYHDIVNFAKMDIVLDMLSKKFEKNAIYTKEELGLAWAEFNKTVYNNAAVQFEGTWSYGYIIPHSTEKNKSIYYSGNSEFNPTINRYISVPNKPIEF